MATFKVWQRVRLAYGKWPQVEATITEIPPTNAECLEHECAIVVDGYPSRYRTGEYTAMFEWLRPLTDPKADAFLERIRKLQPLDEPVTA